jgi:hypothetical protein
LHGFHIGITDDWKSKSSEVKEGSSGVVFTPNVMKIYQSVQRLLLWDRHTDTYIDVITVVSNLMGKFAKKFF